MKACLLLLVILCISGCYPMRSTFYSPSGPSGKTVLSDCYGKAGVPNKFDINFPGFKGFVSTSLNDQGNKIRLSLLLNIEKGKAIDLKSKSIEIQMGNKKLVSSFDKVLAWNYGEAGLSRDETLVGFHDVTQQTTFSGSSYQAYEFTTDFDISSDEFTVRLPIFMIGLEVIDIGEIHFVKMTSTVIMPVNC